MNKRTICQSCGMPLDDNNLLGTEKDGSKSHDYCTYCYQQGKFLNPEMTLEEMRSLVKKIMEEKKIPASIIEAGINQLPTLDRWKVKSHSMIL
jgi:hypothetical protein